MFWVWFWRQGGGLRLPGKQAGQQKTVEDQISTKLEQGGERKCKKPGDNKIVHWSG